MKHFLRALLSAGLCLAVLLSAAPAGAVFETPELFFCTLRCENGVGGTLTLSKSSCLAGEKVTVTAVPDAGYRLKTVLVDGTPISGTTFTVSGSHRVSARFEPLPELELLSLRLRDGEGDPGFPAERLVVSVSVRNHSRTEPAELLLICSGSGGRFLGLLRQTVDALPVGEAGELSFTVDNRTGELRELRVVALSSLSEPLPLGEALSLG